jgi:hypothetical protein
MLPKKGKAKKRKNVGLRQNFTSKTGLKKSFFKNILSLKQIL